MVRSPETSTVFRLLDAAEELFVIKGIKTTSVRDIASKAKANIASINYYFGSKAHLVEAVFKRRIEEINSLRIAELNGLKNSKTKPTVEEILLAFFKPAFSFISSSKGNKNLTKLFALMHTELSDKQRKRIFNLFKPVAHQFLNELDKTLSAPPSKRLIDGFLFSLGAMVFTLFNPNLAQELTEEKDKTVKKELDKKTLNSLVVFCASGIKTLAHKENEE